MNRAEDMTTWRKEIEHALEMNNEAFDDVVDMIFAGDIDEVFDSGYGCSQGCNFTVWTKDRVYFPVVHDGAEWVGSVPRNPCDEATRHKGGG